MKTSTPISTPHKEAFPKAVWAFLCILFLLLPSLLWIIRDRAVWPWDQAWYGQVSTDLWNWLWHSPQSWVTTMTNGLDIKPPGIVWLGQFFVGLRGLSGSVEASLLLFILVTQFVLLYVIFKIGQAMLPGPSVAPACGVLFAASTQLFIGLSHEFFVEPLQAVTVAWAFYVAHRSLHWPKPRVMIHLGAVLILGVLSKATTPMYCVFPLAYAAVQIVRRPPTEGFGAEMKVRSSRALVLVFGILGVLCALWYTRHLSDVWRHVHDSSTGDVALEYGSRDTVFNKLIVWARILRSSFFAPYLSWAFGAALLLGPVRSMFQGDPMTDTRLPKVRPVAFLSILQIVLVLFIVSSAIAVDARYTYALLPCVTIVFMQVCAFVPNKGLIALVLICFVQWVCVHAAALSPDVHIADRSGWLVPLQPDSSHYDEVARAVRLMSEGPEHNNIVGIEEPWLNSNSLSFFAAKDRLITGVRTYFVSLGYAQKDAAAAFRLIDEYHARYVVTLAESSQNAPPNFLNLAALPVLKQIREDGHFTQAPFRSRNGLVIFRADPGPGAPEMAAVPASDVVPPAIAEFKAVRRGKSALDSLNGSVRAPDGSFHFATDGGASCDGWAFDDMANSTPEDVWIELTQGETGHRYYWHAHRYARPALAESLKIPSVKNAGFLCDPAGYKLPAGTYSAQVYQIHGKIVIVSDFSTYTRSPRVTVK